MHTIWGLKAERGYTRFGMPWVAHALQVEGNYPALLLAISPCIAQWHGGGGGDRQVTVSRGGGGGCNGISRQTVVPTTDASKQHTAEATSALLALPM